MIFMELISMTNNQDKPFDHKQELEALIKCHNILMKSRSKDLDGFYYSSYMRMEFVRLKWRLRKERILNKKRNEKNN